MTTKQNEKKLQNIFIATALVFCLAFFALVVIADTPAGSITIYGPNGTEFTGSRNVILNLSYSSSHGIDRCRWANDAQSNLNSAPWEVCTTAKAWILSPGFANKTVYFQIRDLNLDTATYNDSIIFQFMQDYTPPTPPTVYDGLSGDIDWWNGDTTLNANWFNSTDDISTIYYRYRILNDSSCYNNDCNWTNTGTSTTITVSNLALDEGRNYSFEVQAYNPSNLSSTSAISNGTIIDLTKPNNTFINSSTHPSQSTPFDSATAIFNFTADDPQSNGVASGVEGFSYLLDKHPGTAPDSIIEERYWETLAYMHKGSYNQTLKVNGSAASDVAYAVFSQLDMNLTENDSIRVKAALAEQFSDYGDLMGIKVYLTKVDTVGNPITTFDMESDAISNIENVSQDILYVEDLADARIYEFELTVNETVNINNDDIYVAIAGLPDDDDNREPLAISATTNLALVDNTTKNYVCDENDNCDSNTNTLDYSIEVKRQDSGNEWEVQYDLLGDGIYYFHAKPKDIAGNWGDPAHYRIRVAAGGVNSLIYSPVDGEVFTADGNEVNITVGVSVAGNASVQVIALHPDGSNHTSSSVVFDDENEFENITLELGQNELYAMTTTAAGARARSESVYVTVSSQPQPPTNKTLRVVYTGGGAVESYLTYATQAASYYVGSATETSGSITAGGTVEADTDLNTIKIFMTTIFDTTEIDQEFQDNEFLDRINPRFSFRRGASDYLIRHELRYEDIFLGGNFYLPPGVYNMYLRKTGITSDGRYNITLTIE
jgi:hypothetical protein